MGYFQIIRADGSSKRYSLMIKMLQNINKEDLETLWKFVKAKHGSSRPEEAYEKCYGITTARRVSTVRRIKTRERIKMKIVYQDYLRDNQGIDLKLGSTVPPTNTDASSLQELDLLFSPLYEEYFTAGNQSVSKPFALSDNLQQ
ncbi:hypothetical protein Tco_0710256 [Tanacetum coccineum]